MGFLSKLNDGRKLAFAFSSLNAEAAAAARGTQETLPYLRSKGVEFVRDMAQFHAGAPGRALPGFIDMPGFAVGDRFRVAAESRAFGVGGFHGTAVVDELSPTALRVQVEGGLGPFTQTVEIHAHQLSGKLAEFSVTGFGPGTPFLAQIQEAATGVVQMKAVGASHPVRVAAQGADRMTLSFQVGSEPSRLVLERLA